MSRKVNILYEEKEKAEEALINEIMRDSDEEAGNKLKKSKKMKDVFPSLKNL